ncbi:ASCH/PUA domain-containing protein [Paenibacillus sp. RUD330]|uniref:ASCH/PUA domain-containing protein n=1 Tax=Paenibacillus sp. RUD330 TaxID=2023772 RepID=UPI000B9292DD|nr:ASCH/PUA domain-containing protein [Paenibacillus sp. RUD330]ASS66241.1 DUF3850 domain-containing protein [Paenibacillus sp. RUD330]
MSEVTVHHLKIWPEFFQAVYDQQKTFEVRKADRPYRVGDELLLREWDPAEEGYTGRDCSRKVLYILSDPNYVKEGFVILAIH